MRNTVSCDERFESLVNEYQRRLYLFALRILRNREDAEEAVQDAFVRAHRAWAEYEATQPHSEKLKAWLFKIVLNVSRTRLRRKRITQANVYDPSASPATILDQYATFELVQRTIGSLPSHLLETARLRFIEGLMPSEIARQSSRPVGTIKSRLFRARRLLRRHLEPILAGTV